MKKTKKLTVVAYQESTGRQYAETLQLISIDLSLLTEQFKLLPKGSV